MDPNRLAALSRQLLDAYGPQHWWPAGGRFEMIAGAILTQRTAWSNAAAAIDALRGEGLLDPAKLQREPLERIAELVRPAGFYNAKAKKLKAFLGHLYESHQGDLTLLLDQPCDVLRSELLSIWGIGPETADAILVYAARKPSFVVDTYTVRLLLRTGLLERDPGYEEVRRLWMEAMPADAKLYGEIHALIVRHGKERCRATPQCDGCPLRPLCPGRSARGKGTP